MAKLVGTFFHSHGGTTSLPPELWVERRNSRPIRSDVPNESLAKNTAKSERVHKGFQTLRDKVQELKVDVLIVFSDDQLECFDFNNYPAFAVYVGEKFSEKNLIILAADGQLGKTDMGLSDMDSGRFGYGFWACGWFHIRS